MRVWEDLYGRGLSFFICSTIHYLFRSKMNENISFFELEASKRYLFATRLACKFLAYMFLALAAEANPNKLHMPLAILFVSSSIVRLICSSKHEPSIIQVGSND